jgi:hypothetical protein
MENKEKAEKLVERGKKRCENVLFFALFC